MYYLVQIFRQIKLLAFVFALSSPANAVEVENPKIILELYTSQGCSSCPAADKIFKHFIDSPDILALSLHVTYWDRLGWKDNLAKPAFTNRQYNYADTIKTGQVYTPQMVVDGRKHIIGSRLGDIELAVQKAKMGKSLLKPLNLELVENKDGLNIVISPIEDTISDEYKIIALPYITQIDAKIKKGENAGKNISYYNVVKEIYNLGNEQSDTVKAKFNNIDLAYYSGVAVLVQKYNDNKEAEIIRAAHIKF